MQVDQLMQTQAKALADPSRFRLFQFVASSSGPVGVADMTELLGFNHNAIRQHVAILVQAGLIDESDEKRSTRGRPRKQYELRSDALSAFSSVSGSYERLAQMLLELVDSLESPYEVGFRAGRAEASEVPVALDRDVAVELLVRNLSRSGFEPSLGKKGVIKLHNCPFADVATKDPGVVCELHRGLINGFLSAGDDSRTGTLDVKKP